MEFNQKNLTQLFFTFLIAALSFMTSCRKNPDEVAALISNSEATELVETSMASKTAGLSMPAVDATQVINAYLNNCNVPGDTTLSKSKSSGSATYNYTFNLDWLITCSNFNIPQSAQINIAGNGNFNSLHWTGADVTSGSLIYTGLEYQSPNYVANGSYTLEGDVTGSLRRTDPSIHCSTLITLVDLTINKNSLSVTGGTGTVQITGTAANGASKTLTGSLVFNGNNTVTVTVDGYSYTFQL